MGVFDPEKGKDFTVVYRDADRIAFGKRVHIESFIHDKEYRFFKDEKGKLDLLLDGDRRPASVHLQFVAAKRQRQKESDFDLGDARVRGHHRARPAARAQARRARQTPAPGVTRALSRSRASCARR